VRHSGKLYRGKIETFPGASNFAARELTIRCESKLSLETDGEVVTLPEGVESKFEFKVLGGVFPLVL